ncbi:hypothetical protein KI387_013677, partial [Taxus chinensis]
VSTLGHWFSEDVNSSLILYDINSTVELISSPSHLPATPKMWEISRKPDSTSPTGKSYPPNKMNWLRYIPSMHTISLTFCQKLVSQKVIKTDLLSNIYHMIRLPSFVFLQAWKALIVCSLKAPNGNEAYSTAQKLHRKGATAKEWHLRSIGLENVVFRGSEKLSVPRKWKTQCFAGVENSVFCGGATLRWLSQLDNERSDWSWEELESVFLARWDTKEEKDVNEEEEEVKHNDDDEKAMDDVEGEVQVFRPSALLRLVVVLVQLLK